MIEFTHNNRRHADRSRTPFELIMGTAPLALPITHDATRFPDVETKIKMMQSDREEALAAHELARRRMKERITKEVKFEKGDKVWLEAKNLKLGYQTKKMAPKREGPFEIIEVLSPLTYRLKLPVQWRIHDVFHAVLLSPYRENEVHGPNFIQPPPDLIEGEEEYEIESIVGHKKRGRGYLYRIRWKGYSSGEDTWQTAESFTHAKEILADYRRYHDLL